MMTHPFLIVLFYLVNYGLWAPLLLLIIPPFRNWCREERITRWVAILTLALFALLATALLHSTIGNANLAYAQERLLRDDFQGQARYQQQVVVDALRNGGIAGLVSGALSWALTPLRTASPHSHAH